jgi:nitrite reductase/ring-hydroxylating ferredoxin subunit
LQPCTPRRACRCRQTPWPSCGAMWLGWALLSARSEKSRKLVRTIRAAALDRTPRDGSAADEGGHVFALDNRCPHMGFPLERGSVEEGILTCHWHHARFDLASGCTFDLWADDLPTCPVEIGEGGEIWVKPLFGYTDPIGHWRQRLEDGLGHNLTLVIAKAVHGQLAVGQSPSEVIRPAALFGTRNRDGWGAGLTELLNHLSPRNRAFRYLRVIALIGIAPIPNRRSGCTGIGCVIIASARP